MTQEEAEEAKILPGKDPLLVKKKTKDFHF
jgi:hypothetical protein